MQRIYIKYNCELVLVLAILYLHAQVHKLCLLHIVLQTNKTNGILICAQVNKCFCFY